MCSFEALPDECACQIYRACDIETRRSLLFSVPRAKFRAHLTTAFSSVLHPPNLDTDRFPLLQAVSIRKTVGPNAGIRREILFQHQANLSHLTLEYVSLDFVDATDPFASMPQLKHLVLRNSDLAGWSVKEIYELACVAGVKDIEVEGYFPPEEFEELLELQEAGCCGWCYWNPAELWGEVTLFC